MNTMPKMNTAGTIIISTQLANTHKNITTIMKSTLASNALKFIRKEPRKVSSPKAWLFSCAPAKFHL
jgi:hypothetical protein